MSDQFPSAGGLSGFETDEPRIRGAFGEVGEPLEEGLSDPAQDGEEESGDGDEADGESETLPPSPDQV